MEVRKAPPIVPPAANRVAAAAADVGTVGTAPVERLELSESAKTGTPHTGLNPGKSPGAEAMGRSLPARALGPVVSAVKEGRVTRFLKGMLRMLTPGPAQLAQFKRAVDFVKNRVWNPAFDAILQVTGLKSLSRDMRKHIHTLEHPPTVNPHDPAVLTTENAKAKRALADPALKAQAEQALGKLTARERETYAALARQLGDHPRGQAALAELARQGKLAARDAQGGASLLAHLHALATQAVHPEVAKAGQSDLLAQVVQELAHPTAIAQKGKNTCAATVAQNILAREHPAEYARLLVGLASPAGEVTMQNGDTLERQPHWDSDTDASRRFGGHRSISSRLLQPAYMQYGGTWRYDNVKDGHVNPLTGGAVMGMLPYQLAKLLEASTGREYNAEVLFSNAAFREEVQKASPERPLPIALNYAEFDGEVGPHWVQVIGYDAKTDRLIALNPWGRREAIDMDAAESHLLSMVKPD